MLYMFRHMEYYYFSYAIVTILCYALNRFIQNDFKHPLEVSMLFCCWYLKFKYLPTLMIENTIQEKNGEFSIDSLSLYSFLTQFTHISICFLDGRDSMK